MTKHHSDRDEETDYDVTDLYTASIKTCVTHQVESVLGLCRGGKTILMVGDNYCLIVNEI